MNTDFEQLGGYNSLEFFLVSETENWPIVVNDQTSNLVDLSTYQLQRPPAIILPESIDVNITPKQSADGTIYPIEVLFSFHNRTEALEQYLDRFQNQPVVVLATLNTGKKKLYGTNMEPLILNYKIDEGKKAED